MSCFAPRDPLCALIAVLSVCNPSLSAQSEAERATVTLTLKSARNFGVSGVRIQDITPDGRYAYGGAHPDDRSRGVVSVFDLSVPSRLLYLGGGFVGGTIRDLKVKEPFAFAADATTGLRVIDVSDRSWPRFVTSLSTGREAQAIDLHGNYAFLADGSAGLRIINVSDPTQPKIEGSLATDGPVVSLQVVSNFVYLADQRSLKIVDVSNPARPTIVGKFDSRGVAWSVFVTGTRALVAEGVRDDLNVGLRILDVSDPTNPRLIGSVIDPGWQPLDAVLHREFAYVTSGFLDRVLGMQVFDLSNLADPKYISSPDLKFLPRNSYHHDLKVSGDFVFAGGIVYDIKDSGALAFRQSSSGGVFDGLELAGNVAYVGAQGDRWHVYDVSDSQSPKLIGRGDNTIGRVYQLAGNQLYVSAVDGGVDIFDISSLASPKLTGRIEPKYPYGIRDVQAVGGMAYLGYYNNSSYKFGLWIVDINRPDLTPPTLTAWDFGAFLGVIGEFAYFSEAPPDQSLSQITRSRMHVYHVKDPRNPIRTATLETSIGVKTLQVVGNLAYVAGDHGLEIIDISTLSSPRRLGVFTIESPSPTDPLARQINAVHVADGFAFALNWDGSFRVVDVRDPENPKAMQVTRVAPQDFSIGGTRLHVAGNRLIVAGGSLQIYEFTVLEPPPTGVVADWIAQQFPLVPSVQRGPRADPDGDGAQNSLEYFFGTDPGEAQPRNGRLPSGSLLRENSQTFWTLSFPVNSALSPTVQWRVEQSRSMFPPTWLPVAAEFIQMAGNRINVKVPAVTGEAYFRLRLIVP